MRRVAHAPHHEDLRFRRDDIQVIALGFGAVQLERVPLKRQRVPAASSPIFTGAAAVAGARSAADHGDRLPVLARPAIASGVLSMITATGNRNGDMDNFRKSQREINRRGGQSYAAIGSRLC